MQLNFHKDMKSFGFVIKDFVVLQKLLDMHEDGFHDNIPQYAGRRIVEGLLRRYEEVRDILQESTLSRAK